MNKEPFVNMRIWTVWSRPLYCCYKIEVQQKKTLSMEDPDNSGDAQTHLTVRTEHDIWLSQDVLRNVWKWGALHHYENTPIQIYWNFHHQKTESFQIKILIFFLFLLKT